MKLPNGYGSVHKLSGAKRRKPWRARITDGYEYTLVVQNFELIYNNKGKYMDYSGIVQLVFAENQEHQGSFEY